MRPCVHTHAMCGKGDLVEERLYKKLHFTANLNFLLLSLFVYLLDNSSSQFFSYWESAEPVFSSEELSCLPYKKQNKSMTLSFWKGKFNFSVLWGFFIKPFFLWATFSHLGAKNTMKPVAHSYYLSTHMCFWCAGGVKTGYAMLVSATKK